MTELLDKFFATNKKAQKLDNIKLLGFFCYNLNSAGQKFREPNS